MDVNKIITTSVFNQLKDTILKTLTIPSDTIKEKQLNMLQLKFRALSNTEIGRKIGVKPDSDLEELPKTEYSFYRQYYENPSPSAFMYPLDHYYRAKTSGTRGSEKWFLLPKDDYQQMLRETLLLQIFTMFHDGVKINLDYGDKVYYNLAPRPFAAGFLAELSQQLGFIKLVPDQTLPFHDKLDYLIKHYKEVEAVGMTASSLISRVKPSMEDNLDLKAAYFFDSQIAEVYYDDLVSYTKAIPKTTYSSTETGFCSISSVEHPLRFIFDWRRGIFEFMRVKDGKVEAPVPFTEVKVGEIYEILYTSFLGEFTRYVIEDGFECVSIGDNILGTDLPVFKFRGRMDKTLSMQNFTRIDEGEVIEVLSNVNLKYVDFVARIEIENGMEYLKLYIEYDDPRSVETINHEIHDSLFDLDRDYRDLSNFYSYTPISVEKLVKNTFREYLERKSGSFPKVDRINMSMEELDLLLGMNKSR